MSLRVSWAPLRGTEGPPPAAAAASGSPSPRGWRRSLHPQSRGEKHGGSSLGCRGLERCAREGLCRRWVPCCRRAGMRCPQERSPSPCEGWARAPNQRADPRLQGCRSAGRAWGEPRGRGAVPRRSPPLSPFGPSGIADPGSPRRREGGGLSPLPQQGDPAAVAALLPAGLQAAHPGGPRRHRGVRGGAGGSLRASEQVFFGEWWRWEAASLSRGLPVGWVFLWSWVSWGFVLQLGW